MDAELLVAGDPELKRWADTAINAAVAAGASYADVHVIHTRYEEIGYYAPGARIQGPDRRSTIGFGVRALVRGYWGFSGLDGMITTDVAARAGRDAANQAAMSATGKPRTVELASMPVATGSWVMPVEIDPFTVSQEEKADYLNTVCETVHSLRDGVGMMAEARMQKQERTFVSSEGSYTTQTLYQTGAWLTLDVWPDWMTELSGRRSIDFVSVAGAGWEYLRNAPVRERVSRVIEEALSMRRPKPVDVGRYDLVLDAKAMADLIGTSVGVATELDRAMGYEANGVGTSYLAEPLDMLGNFKMGSSLLTVTANRSMPNGAATVKWDDEGVEPRETTLVKNGILTDFQTTREAASWLAAYYQKLGKPVASNGCAGMYAATSPMQQVSPNLVVQPGAHAVTFDDLVKDTKKGIAIVGGYSGSDQQVLNGYGMGQIVYEIADGKVVGTFSRAQYLYRSPDFWKNLIALGGERSAEAFGFERSRDSYDNRAAHTIVAVPAKVTGVAVVDYSRQA